MSGHKRITLENWMQPDPASAALAIFNRADGSHRAVTADDYVGPALQPQLHEGVPEDIRDLYEVARGALAYGYYFYPLFTLATDQCMRVAEAAVDARARALGCPSKVRTFHDRIEWLVARGTIPDADRESWHGIREMRNESSHPRHQHILTAAMVFDMFHHIADRVNSLFPAA